MTATETATRLALTAAQAAADKLAQDVVLLDVSDQLQLTDVFLVCSGATDRQVAAIVDEVQDRCRTELGEKPLRVEAGDRTWVLLDYGDVVVHVQQAEERAFYQLERLWKDCPAIPFVDAALPSHA